MALVLKDRVVETSTSSGTGTFTLSGAQTGYQSFAAIGDGNTTYYTIQGKNSDGTLTGEWEVGAGTYNAGTLSRDTVLESSNGGSLVNFAVGLKDVFCDLPAEYATGGSGANFPVNTNITSMTGLTGGIETPDYVQLDTTATPTIALGKLRWNTTTATASFGIVDGTDEVNIGEQLFAYVTNADSVTITRGQPVYLFGATGNRASVKLASNLGDATSAKTLGLVAQDSIAAGATGFVISQGQLSKLDTSAYTAGDTLYLGATAGTLTATKPKAPNHLVYIGVVERSNAGNGQMYVRAQNGYELDEIHDVQINSPANGQTIIYDQTNALWKNANLTAGAGVSITNGASAITVTNTAPDQVVSLTGAGTTTVTGTYPSFTITSTGGAGGGDVSGPSSAVNNNFASYNGTTGKIIKDSGYSSSSFAPATSGTSILYGNGSGGFSNVTIGSNLTFVGGTLSATGGGGSPAGSNTQVQYNNSGAFGASSTFTFNGTTLVSPNVEATGGLLADGSFGGTYVDGIVVDYDSVGAAGRISVGGADSLNFYNGGVAGSLLGSINNAGDWKISRFLSVGNGTLIGGSTNPIIAAAGSANQYVQSYIHNDLNGVSSSADLACYPDNGTDASGWIDMGITSSAYADASYPITGANEGYIFMSAPSGAGKTGNLVYATDSTGSSNAHQWYVGGFGASKSAYKMQLGSSALDLKTTVSLNGSAGTSGQVLTSAGAGSIPTWTTPTTGTVTSVSALTLGTTGTDLSSSVATGTTTPVITLNVPTASASNRGALSSTDWSTFNGKQAALVSGTNIKTINGTSILGSGDLTVSAAAGGSNTQVQYNSSGALTGSANLTFDGTTLTAAGLSGPHNGTVGATTPNTGAFTGITVSAGTASVAPIKLTSGTNLTTTTAGAIEYDGSAFYNSIAASTRGVMPSEQLVVLNSTYTLTSQTAAQKLFNASTNGAVTLPIGTYQFECCFSLSSLSATTGSFGFALVAGTAVIGSQGWWAYATKPATLATAGNASTTYNTAANTTLVTTNTSTNAQAMIKGVIKITTAGTIIPSVSLGVAAAAIVGINSYFKISPISGTSAANITVGNWS